MATIAVKQAVISGTNLSVAGAAAGGDEFVNSDRRTLLIVRINGAVTPTITITPAVQPTPGLNFAPVAFVVAGIGWYVLGPFPPRWFNNANNRVQITYSGVTNVFVSPIHI